MAHTKFKLAPPAFVNLLLNKINKESREEYNDMQQTFNLLGWGELPDELKIEIYVDAKYIAKELNGSFSSCDPFVQRRRDTIFYWVNSFNKGICSLETAVNALKIKPL